MVIDLDAGPPPPPPRRRRVPWWAVPVVLATAVTATLQLPPAAPMIPVAELPPGTMRLAGAGDAFYVLRGNGTLAWNVTAYAWSDGTERWRRPLAGPDPDLMIAGAAVLVTHQPCDPQRPPSVDRLDPLTGRPLWTAPGAVLPAGAGLPTGELLLVQGAGCGDRRQVTSLTAADPVDGSPRWTVRFPSGRPVVAGDGWFAAVDGDGGVDTYAMDGRRLGSGTVTETSIVLAAGGSLIAADQPDPGRPGLLTGLPHGAPDPAWTIPLDGAAAACGPWLCVTGSTATGLETGQVTRPVTGQVTRAVDPATGRTRWTTRAFEQQIAGPGSVIGPVIGSPIGAGVRIVRWSDGGELPLPGWRLLPPVDGSAAPVVQRGDLVGVADLTAGRLDVLGTLPGPQRRCLTGGLTASGLRLVCVDATGRTRLWRRF